MKKYLLLGIVLILLSSFSFAADGCVTGQNCTWYAYGVSGENGANISFTYENETTTQEFVMESLGLGKYLYTTTHNVTSNVMGCTRSYNSTGTIDEVCESKEIYFDVEMPGGSSGMTLAPIATILGVAVVGLILLFIAFKLDEDHIIWKLFIILMVSLMLIFVPKAAIDSNKNCVVAPVSSTIQNGVASYNYDLVCSENEETTASNFFKTYMWIVRILFIYLMLYIFLRATNNLNNLPKLYEKMNRGKRK